jgi:lantibiotic modifying enzyme
MTEIDPDRAARYLDVATSAGRWIVASAIETPDGRAWPAVPDSPEWVPQTLYSGQAGVALFLSELARSTGDDSFAEAAGAAARSVATHPDIGMFGLYSGLAGMALAVRRSGDLLDDSDLRDRAEGMVDLLLADAIEAGSGVEWPAEPDGRGPWQELFRGTAGIALTLLVLGRTDDAITAGRRLLDLPIEAPIGHWWKSRPDDHKPAPNIAHGTAGVSYALAALSSATGIRAFGDAAIGGAEYLISIARTDDDTFAVHHHEVDGTDLYTIGWCSGPPGLAGLFLRLEELTGRREWRDWALRCARTVTTSGIPERRYAGFWDNVCQCCGSSGVADFFIGLHEATGDPQYLDFALVVLDDIVDRATRDETGTRWHNIEHTVDPPELPAETSYMQGASGVGSALLRASRYLHGGDSLGWLPSWPFAQLPSVPSARW